MKDKFKNIYTIESARAKWWDYGKDCIYCITICTKDRFNYFGIIENDKVIKSPIGFITEKILHLLPDQFEYVNLHKYVIMPNHIHAILEIKKNKEQNKFKEIYKAELLNEKKGGVTGKNNPMLHENLSRIIRWYKGRTSFEIRKIKETFKWQSNYYDRIISDVETYNIISKYISSNPENWEKDEFNI